MEDMTFKVSAAVSKVNVADCDYNTDSIINVCETLNGQGVDLAVFPELSVTGCTCGDLFGSEVLVVNSHKSLKRIADASRAWRLTVIVGAVVSHENRLYNCGVMISHGGIVAAVPSKTVGRSECFAQGEDIDTTVEIEGVRVPLVNNRVVRYGDFAVSIIVGEGEYSNIPIDANVLAHLGACRVVMGSRNRHIDAIVKRSEQFGISYIYSGAGYGESTTDKVYDGIAVIAEDGELKAQNAPWQWAEQVVVAEVGAERHRLIGRKCVYELDTKESFKPFVPYGKLGDECYSDAVNIQVMGLMRRMEVTRCRNIVLGISGGLDSTLALLVAVKTFDRMGYDRMGIVGVTMPGFGTTDRTYRNALVMMRSLGISIREISIVNAVKQHFADIGHNASVHDVTYENSQARERTQILMDIANQVGGMVLGTGDMSELALGWATYNGDHMSMYGINAGVPKTLVRRLVQWIAETETDEACRNALFDVIDTPISPELIPADKEGNIKQKTEDLVGPYELHDFFMYYVLKYGYSPRRVFKLAEIEFEGMYDQATIKHWLTTFFRRFFSQQFKRSCMPDGPCVCGISLSPRGAWNMPSDASSALWLKECEGINV